MYPVPPMEPAPKKHRKWPWITAAAVILLIVAISATSNPDREAGTASAATTSANAPTSSAAVTTTTEPTTTTTPPPPPPSVYNGKGDDVITLDRPQGLKVIHFACAKCTGNTVLKSDGAESLLVNTIGAYDGQRWADIRDGSVTSSLTVSATGAWTITVGGIEMADVAGTGTANGRGDDVVLMPNSSTKAAVVNKGDSNFVVEDAPLAGGYLDLAVNEIGGYQGTVPLSGPALVQVTSSGTWSIAQS